MVKANELETRICVQNNRNLFENVAKGYINAKDIYRTQYTVLNYEVILTQMIEFLEGYVEYTKHDDKKYDGKVLMISRNFYDKMFREKDKYRKVINLEQYPEMNKKFLEKTKQLQSVIEGYLKNKPVSGELNSLIALTNNQYKKLAKVCRDDMKIYLWLTTSNSVVFKYNIDESTRSEFSNKNSPVMHKHVKK